MKDTLVVLCDGTTLCGPIWMWRPAEGYCTIGDYDDGRTEPTRVELADVVIAKTEGRDELARARQQGWQGT